MTEDERSHLIRIMAEIKKEPEGLKAFAADPLAYLQRKGINTDGLFVAPTLAPNPPGLTTSGEVTDADLALVAGGGCFSVGYYACYSEG